MTSIPDLYTCELSTINADQLRRFVDAAIAARVQAESVVLEFKSRRDKSNLVDAVAALSNTDGGLVLVGVDETASDPIQGVPASEVDSAVQSLRQLTPDAMPEVVPIALPDRPGRVVVVLRVDADRVEAPVVVHGRVLVRLPGATVGATRDQIWALFARRSAEPTHTAFVIPSSPVGVSMWDAEGFTGMEVRVAATVCLPHRANSRRWIGSEAIEELRRTLEESVVVAGTLASGAKANESHRVDWVLTEKSALRYRLRSSVRGSVRRSSPAMQMSLLVTFSGRALQVLVSARFSPQTESGPLVLSRNVQDLREAVLAVACVAAQGCCTVGNSMGLGAPVASRVLEGAIIGRTSLAALELPAHWGASPIDPNGPRHLPRTELQTLDPVDLMTVVDAWLTEMLLDFGATGFEADVAGYRAPKWFTVLA